MLSTPARVSNNRHGVIGTNDDANDEPAAGKNPTEKVELMKLIQFVRDQFKIAILLVEHDMAVVMGVCNTITVLNFGTVLACGTPLEVQADEGVREAYLGRSI